MQTLVMACALLLSTLRHCQFQKQTAVSRREDGRILSLDCLGGAALGAALELCPEVACGQVDVEASGKKKRDFNDEQRYQILRSLIERAAENNMAQ
ncbi:hypothetical protein ACOMHN_000636 [Nucella lapillus]